jgi:acetolactate synthase I/II/III large subunit
MTADASATATGADAFIEQLVQLGIHTIYANAGTDFPPIIEALSKAAARGTAIQAIAVPHENLAVSMAYGHFLVSGRPQALMLHVNVGTANAVCALMNAFRERIPLIVAAGRTPYTEKGHPASRSMFIHWAQEMFDQASLVREAVKWDYEIKLPEQVRPAVDRAVSLAMSEPRGPVYLTLPREMLASALSSPGPTSKPQPPAERRTADPTALERAARMLAEAERPLIITASLGQDHQAVEALGSLAEAFAVPVVCHVPKSLCLSTDHPMHMGYAPAELLKDADAVVVLECDVPWFPNAVSPPEGAKIIHIGVDPLFGRYGIRSFPCDLALAGDPALILPVLERMIGSQAPLSAAVIEKRRGEVAQRRAARRARLDAFHERVKDDDPIHPAALAREIDRIKGPDTILINELGVQIDYLTLTRPGTYFQQSSAGGLGWGLGAALGIKLAAPDRFVIAMIGDGSYMFGNPTPAHFISRALDLPVLFIVSNNAGWASVRSETRALYPDGFSQSSNDMPLTNLRPTPSFERVVEASDGYGERVERIADLRAALERAVHAVKVEKRQALVNVLCRML